MFYFVTNKVLKLYFSLKGFFNKNVEIPPDSLGIIFFKGCFSVLSILHFFLLPKYLNKKRLCYSLQLYGLYIHFNFNFGQFSRTIEVFIMQ